MPTTEQDFLDNPLGTNPSLEDVLDGFEFLDDWEDRYAFIIDQSMGENINGLSINVVNAAIHQPLSFFVYQHVFGWYIGFLKCSSLVLRQKAQHFRFFLGLSL